LENLETPYLRKGCPMRYVCQICGYIYDPEVGDADLDIAPGTAWESLPDDFICPVCGVGKDQFEAE
jgi:rubredoxin